MSGSGFVGLHMGAGYHSPNNWDTYNEVCKSACLKAIEVLRSANNALEAVVAATVYLENSTWSNAGLGSNLSLNGNVECDASLMDGNSLLFGATGAVSGVKNPVKLAESILLHQAKGDMSLGRVPPCLLVGTGAHRWAVENGIEVVKEDDLITEASRKSYIKNKRKLEFYDSVWETDCRPDKIFKPEDNVHFADHMQNESLTGIGSEVEITDEFEPEKRLDTIGVVCVDGCGRVASAVSSGGILLKQPGRIGQAALYGCGCWAENECQNVGVAATTSGCGEHLMKTFLARECAESLKSAEAPVQSLIDCFQKKFLGSPFLSNVKEPMGGVLTLKVTEKDSQNLQVDFSFIHTTESLSVGFMSTSDPCPQAFISRIPKDHLPGNSITAGSHDCVIPFASS